MARIVHRPPSPGGGGTWLRRTRRRASQPRSAQFPSSGRHGGWGGAEASARRSSVSSCRRSAAVRPPSTSSSTSADELVWPAAACADPCGVILTSHARRSSGRRRRSASPASSSSLISLTMALGSMPMSELSCCWIVPSRAPSTLSTANSAGVRPIEVSASRGARMRGPPEPEEELAGELSHLDVGRDRSCHCSSLRRFTGRATMIDVYHCVAYHAPSRVRRPRQPRQHQRVPMSQQTDTQPSAPPRHASRPMRSRPRSAPR